MQALIGQVGLILLAIAMLCGIVSGLNAFYLSGSRLLYSIAIADALPKRLQKLDSKYHVPRLGILFMMVLAVIAPFFGRQVLSWLVDMTAVGADLGFLYATAAAFVTARREGNKKQMVIMALARAFALFFILLLKAAVFPRLPQPTGLDLPGCLGRHRRCVLRQKRKDYYRSTALQDKVSAAAQEAANASDALSEEKAASFDRQADALTRPFSPSPVCSLRQGFCCRFC